MRGIVKFFKADKGWGAIMAADLPDGEDAFVHFSAIDAAGYRAVEPGDLVEFEPVAAVQDSFRWVAQHVRRTGPGPAPTLHREGERVIAGLPGDTVPSAR